MPGGTRTHDIQNHNLYVRYGYIIDNQYFIYLFCKICADFALISVRANVKMKREEFCPFGEKIYLCIAIPRRLRNINQGCFYHRVQNILKLQCHFEGGVGALFFYMTMVTYKVKIQHFTDFIDRFGDYEAYALYVAIRCNFRNNKLFKPTPSKVMKFLGVSHARAKRLLEKASLMEGVFHFAKDGGLVALADKGGYTGEKKNGEKYFMDFVYMLSVNQKIEYNGEWKVKSCKLSDITKVLKRLYVRHYLSGRTLVRIKASAEGGSGNGTIQGSLFEKHVERRVTLKHIAQRCGLSKSNCARIIDELASKGEISKTKRNIVRYGVWKDTVGKETKIFRDKRGFAYACHVTSYAVNEFSSFGGQCWFWFKGHHRYISRKKRSSRTANAPASCHSDVASYFNMLEGYENQTSRKVYKRIC